MRRISLISLLVAGLMAVYGQSFGFSKGEQDCSKCHTLNSEQAKKVLSEMVPDVKILSVGPSAIKGFWEVGVESGGRKGIFYLDYSQKYLFLGNLFSIKTRENLTQESFLKISKVDVDQIPLADALVMGEKGAKHKVIVFDDPD